MKNKFFLALIFVSTNLFASDLYVSGLKDIKSGQEKKGYEKLETAIRDQKDLSVKVLVAKILAQADAKLLKTSPLVYGLFAVEHMKGDSPDLHQLSVSIADNAFNEGKLSIAEEYYKKALESDFVKERPYIELQYSWVLTNLKKYNESLRIIEKNLDLISDYRGEFIKIYGRFWIEAKFHNMVTRPLKEFSSAEDQSHLLEGIRKALPLFYGDKARKLIGELKAAKIFLAVATFGIKNLSAFNKFGHTLCKYPEMSGNNSNDYFILLHECLPILSPAELKGFTVSIQSSTGDYYKYLLLGNAYKAIANNHAQCENLSLYFSKEKNSHSLFALGLDSFLSSCSDKYIGLEMQQNLYKLTKNGSEGLGLLRLMSKNPNLLGTEIAKEQDKFKEWPIETQIMYISHSKADLTLKLQLLERIDFDLNSPEWKKALFSLTQNHPLDIAKVLQLLDKKVLTKSLNEEVAQFLVLMMNSYSESDNSSLFNHALAIVRGLTVTKKNSEATLIVHLRDSNFTEVSKNFWAYEDLILKNKELTRNLVLQFEESPIDLNTVQDKKLKSLLTLITKISKNQSIVQVLTREELAALASYDLAQDIQFLAAVNKTKLPTSNDVTKLARVISSIQKLQTMAAKMKWEDSWIQQRARLNYNDLIDKVCSQLEAQEQADYKNLAKELVKWKLETVQS